MIQAARDDTAVLLTRGTGRDGASDAALAVRRLNDEYFRDTGRRRLFRVQTFGCQMNAHDSEGLAGALFGMGFEQAADEKQADLVIYNTCCVRESAENRIYGNLSVLKHEKDLRRAQNRGLTVALCGCMMQQDAAVERIRRSHRYVDIIFGTFNLHRFPELLLSHMETGGQIIDIWREDRDGAGHDARLDRRQFAHKAGVNIMYGCDNFCSYCIVPYVRGRERSRPAPDIINEVGALARDGVREIMLLGQNVNSYAGALRHPGGEKVDFPALLRLVDRACEGTGIRRIRFMTSHPKDLSPALISAMRDCVRVCRHIHLPLQSGSTEILRLMNRRYTREQYLGLIGEIRARMPGAAITTDIIVGFPGETEADFEDTLDAVRQARFSGAFTFLYSKRSGTPAADMPGQVPPDIARARFDRLLDTLNPIFLEINKSHLGETAEVLVDEKGSGPGALICRTDWGGLVHIKGPDDLIGRFTDVKLTDCRTFYFLGETVSGEII